MILPVLQSQSILAAEALVAAYAIDPIDLHPGQPSNRELILVRYAKPPASGHFDFHAIRSKNSGPLAMWSDSLTEDAHLMGDITAFYAPQLITALQVVRLILPSPFDISSGAQSHGQVTLWVKVGPLKKANGASEFWLNFDIHPHQVANIPLAIVHGKFVVDPTARYVKPAPQHMPMVAATYTVHQNTNGHVSCILS